MSFFTFRLRTVQTDNLTQAEAQICSIIRIIPHDTLGFSHQWVYKLLQLFGSKQEMSLFWTFFSQIQINMPLDSQSTHQATNQVNLQHQVLSAMANYSNPQQENQRSSMCGLPRLGSTMGQEAGLQGLSDIDLPAQDFTQPQSMKQYSPCLLYGQNQAESIHNLGQNQTNNYQAEEEMTNSPIISKIVLFKLRKQFQHYRSIKQQFINISEIAKKYCISEITLGRIIKKWSMEPQFSTYLAQIQKKQQLWPIKTHISKEIQAWGKKIEYILARNPYLTCLQIGQQLRLNGNYKIPDEATIKKVLGEMKYVRKRVGIPEIGKNSEQNMRIRKRYCEVYLNMLKKEQTVVFFLDEHRFDIEFQPDYGWARHGEQLPPIPNTSNFYVSLLVLLSQKCPFSFSTAVNLGNQQPTLNYAVQKLAQQIGSKMFGKQVIIIANSQQNSHSNLAKSNAGSSPYQSKLISLARQVFSKYGWKLMLLPPKSSELNPLISFFKEMKDQLRKLRNSFTNLSELQEKINQLCPTLTYFTPNFEQVNKFASKGILNCKF